MAYVITEPCIDVQDKACIEECPVDCIYVGPRMCYIHPDECVDCGACEAVCPMDAIYYEDDVPADLSHYVDANVDVFGEVGSPGGASRIGPLPHDSQLIDGSSKRIIAAPTSETRCAEELTADVSSEGSTSLKLSYAFPTEDTSFRLLIPFFDKIAILGGFQGSHVDLSRDPDLGQVVVSVALDDTVQSYRSRALSLMQKYVSEQMDMDTGVSALSREYNSYIAPHVKKRLEFEMEGEPITACTFIWNTRVQNVAGAIFPQILNLALRKFGTQIAPVTTSARLFEAVRDATGSTSVFDPEPTIPDLSRVPLRELRQFRMEHRDRFDLHTRRMRQLASENSQIPDKSERLRHWAAARDEIADRATELRRSLRHAFEHGSGTWGFGICAAPVLPSSTGSTLDRLVNALGVEVDGPSSYYTFIIQEVGANRP